MKTRKLTGAIVLGALKSLQHKTKKLERWHRPEVTHILQS